MKVIYACYGKAGLGCLYRLISQREIQPEKILAVTYETDDNITLTGHLDALGIDYVTEPINSSVTLERMQAFNPDFLFSIYFRDIISADVLSLIKKSAVNLHPSLLPDYKGCFSAPWVLINGENLTGITYHIVNTGIDTGNIVLQKELEIKSWDTGFSLYHRLLSLGVDQFSEMFQKVVREGFQGIPQKNTGRTYKREIPYGGYFLLEWGRKRIEDYIRAMFFPPYESAKLIFNE